LEIIDDGQYGLIVPVATVTSLASNRKGKQQTRFPGTTGNVQTSQMNR
jgi:hypothetical protein